MVVGGNGSEVIGEGYPHRGGEQRSVWILQTTVDSKHNVILGTMEEVSCKSLLGGDDVWTCPFHPPKSLEGGAGTEPERLSW